MVSISDEEVMIAAKTLYNFLQGKDKINREILYKFPPKVTEALQELDLSEVEDVLVYALFPEDWDKQETEGVITLPSEEDVDLYG